MNLIELQHALRQLRLGGIATVLETRLHQAQAEAMAPIDLISCLVADELTRRGDRLLERRRKQAAFRDPQKTLDHFDFNFNPEDESQSGLRPGHVRLHRQARRRIVSWARVAPARATWPRPSAKPPSSRAIACSIAKPTCCSTNWPRPSWTARAREFMETLTTVPLLIIDDFGMRKLPLTAAEDLLEIIMRRYERASTLLTSNRPVEDWGKLLGDVAAVTAMLDRILHHGHVLKCGPRSWRTKMAAAAASDTQ